MLEVCMSVWPRTSAATTSLSGRELSGRALSGREGDLISVSINVHPRYLESLLETLAQVSFPVNPQIYHDAAIVYLYPDGREETEATTLVEFPAYGSQLEEVRAALQSHGFDLASLEVTSMLEEIQSASQFAAPPPGANYVARQRVKHRAAGAGARAGSS
jgi:hypothetical protein